MKVISRKATNKEKIFKIGSLFLRPIWSTFIKVFFWMYSLILFLTCKQARDYYIHTKKAYNKISNLKDLVFWAKNIYTYVWDDFGHGLFYKKEYRGWLDHDSTPLEFFTRGGGDCDDIALFVKRKLKQLGYNAVRINMTIENTINKGHFDCLFFDKVLKEYCLFNYGKIQSGKTIERAFTQFGVHWKIYKNCYYFKWWY